MEETLTMFLITCHQLLQNLIKYMNRAGNICLALTITATNCSFFFSRIQSCIFPSKKIYCRWFTSVTSPVMLSTLDDGKIVKGLSGIPAEGPVLLVGYHMLLGMELAPMIPQFIIERNILVRGVAHPMLFFRLREGKLPDLGLFDIFRVMGAVPVSGKNLYELMASKSHALLYPGGMREALHRKVLINQLSYTLSVNSVFI